MECEQVNSFCGCPPPLETFSQWRSERRACRCVRTFFNDAAPVVQHALHLAAPHVRHTRLLHEGLAPVEARAVGQVGPHRDQKANVMLPQPCMGLGGGGRDGETG